MTPPMTIFRESEKPEAKPKATDSLIDPGEISQARSVGSVMNLGSHNAARVVW